MYNFDLINCVLPSVFNGKPVLGLAYRALYGSPNITRVFIPKTCNIFLGDAFCKCTKLEEVIFEDGYIGTEFAGYAFYNTSITTFKFPIGSSFRGYFFAYSKIEKIYIVDFMNANWKSVFIDVKQVEIFVPVNYPYEQFCERNVTKILPFFNPKRIKTQCVQHDNSCAYIKFRFAIYVFILI